jgi:hypothetical protein
MGGLERRVEAVAPATPVGVVRREVGVVVHVRAPNEPAMDAEPAPHASSGASNASRVHGTELGPVNARSRLRDPEVDRHVRVPGDADDARRIDELELGRRRAGYPDPAGPVRPVGNPSEPAIGHRAHVGPRPSQRGEDRGTSRPRKGRRSTPLACAVSMPHWTSRRRSPGKTSWPSSADAWFIWNQPNTREPVRSRAPQETVRQ